MCPRILECSPWVGSVWHGWGAPHLQHTQQGTNRAGCQDGIDRGRRGRVCVSGDGGRGRGGLELGLAACPGVAVPGLARVCVCVCVRQCESLFVCPRVPPPQRLHHAHLPGCLESSFFQIGKQQFGLPTHGILTQSPFPGAPSHVTCCPRVPRPSPSLPGCCPLSPCCIPSRPLLWSPGWSLSLVLRSVTFLHPNLGSGRSECG